MPRVREIWSRDGGRCVWCGAEPWARDRTVEHVLPRSRGGTSGPLNLLPACRPCNRARRSRSAAAYVRERAQAPDRRPRVRLLIEGLDRLAANGTPAERRYGARQGQAVRDWALSEEAAAAHAARLA
jgi:hypothetical protein